MLVAALSDIVTGGLIAALSGVLATVVQGVLAARSAKQASRDARIERAALTLGRTLSLLRDATPESVIALPREKASHLILEILWPRWDPLQDELEVLAAGSGAKDIREKAGSLIDSIHKLLGSLRYYADFRANDPLSDEQWEAAKNVHASAKTDAETLLAALRE